ncbi:MAG: manganese efflux pump MntP family protein [Ruminococcus sp.]|nr:manganese efflux pump MntP family protein [Ruminococcus sp.]MCM1480307.1 manganese efflux pump MntP family protein [Muribaculaceae bacterium]
MGFLELFLIGVGLSADAFSVSVCKGLNMRRLNLKHAYVIALFFGVFQAVMPLIGYLLGTGFSEYIERFDHWIAFVLLAFIGGKMAVEAVREKDGEEDEKTDVLKIGELFVLAIATSIDALAVGITFAFLKVQILPSVLLIGATTFALSLGGVLLGNRFGAKYKSKAEIAGGVILVLIGVKILLEHLGIINF